MAPELTASRYSETHSIFPTPSGSRLGGNTLFTFESTHDALMTAFCAAAGLSGQTTVLDTSLLVWSMLIYTRYDAELFSSQDEVVFWDVVLGVNPNKQIRVLRFATILAYGFARVRCESCGDNFLIAYSCKGRGICPS